MAPKRIFSLKGAVQGIGLLNNWTGGLARTRSFGISYGNPFMFAINLFDSAFGRAFIIIMLFML